MIVDCDTCQVRGPACGDCVVTVLLGMPTPQRPVELDEAERAAIGVLSGSGLVPPLRLVGTGVPTPTATTATTGPPGPPARPGEGGPAAPVPREVAGA